MTVQISSNGINMIQQEKKLLIQNTCSASYTDFWFDVLFLHYFLIITRAYIQLYFVLHYLYKQL